MFARGQHQRRDRPAGGRDPAVGAGLEAGESEAVIKGLIVAIHRLVRMIEMVKMVHER